MKWPVAAISKICETGSGTTPSRKNSSFYGGKIPWIKSGELRESLISSSAEFVTEDVLKQTPLKMVPRGAILVAMYGATVGRVGMLNIDATTNQAICHIIPRNGVIDNEYLYHAMHAKAPYLISKGVGGAQPNITQGIVRDTKIPLPPLEEQKRIAAILDQADALRRLRQRAIDRLNTLGQSIFYEMFGDPVNSAGISLGEVLLSSGNGMNVKQDDSKQGVPVTRIETIWNGEIDPDRVKWASPDNEKSRKFFLKYGDILFSHINSPEHIAKTAIYEGEPNHLLHGINLLRLQPNQDMVEPHWLLYLLKSKRVRKFFQMRCKKAVNQASLNQNNIQELHFRLPTLELQNEFADRIKAVVRMKQEIDGGLKKAETLFSSLQRRAFEGEL